MQKIYFCLFIIMLCSACESKHTLDYRGNKNTLNIAPDEIDISTLHETETLDRALDLYQQHLEQQFLLQQAITEHQNALQSERQAQHYMLLVFIISLFFLLIFWAFWNHRK